MIKDARGRKVKAKMQFPTSMQAGKQYQLHLWELADGLLAEVQDQNGGDYGYDAVIADFANRGLTYDRKTLRLLRRTAKTFPKHRRYDGLDLRTHAAANNPDMLDFIVKGAKKAGFAITVKKVKTIVRQWRRAAWMREERKEPR